MTKFHFEKTEKKFIYKLYGVVSKIKNKNTFVAKCLNKDDIWYQINNDSFKIINNNFIKEENNLYIYSNLISKTSNSLILKYGSSANS